MKINKKIYNKAFRAKLRANPKDYIAELGIPIKSVDDLEIIVKTDQKDLIHFPIFPKFSVQYAKDIKAGTGTIGSAGTAGTVGTMACFYTATVSTISCVGSVATAGSQL